MIPTDFGCRRTYVNMTCINSCNLARKDLSSELVIEGRNSCLQLKLRPVVNSSQLQGVNGSSTMTLMIDKEYFMFRLAVNRVSVYLTL